ncbi:MAG TPA: glucosamine-6-phosphate deaminase [Terriglobales bacterium]
MAKRARDEYARKAGIKLSQPQERGVQLSVFPDTHSLSRAAAQRAHNILRTSIRDHGRARLVAATGKSQLEFLQGLTSADDLDWSRVELFHLDEYIGLPLSHPGSLRRYLLEHLVRKTGITRYHFLDGEKEPREAINHVTREIRKAPIDVAFLGVGENGHLAFNDPPADFDTQESFLVVDVSVQSREQQHRSGWFESLDEVPTRAITMTISQILKSQEILCLAPEKRKAAAVARCFQGEISPLAPASILRTHRNALVYLDVDSAALLSPEIVGQAQVVR